MEVNQIIQGDCLEVMKGIDDDSVDLVLTDIPYGEVNRKSNGLRVLNKKKADIVNFDLPTLLKELSRICKGSFYIFCGWTQLPIIKNYFIKNGLSTRVIVWEKTNPSPMNGDFIWLSGIEPAVYGKYPKATFNAHCRNTVLKYSNGSSKIHPTQKNIKLFKDILEVSSNKDDIVFDPFIGSGTTAVACKELGRKYIGIELSPEYVEIARRRISGISETLF